MSVSSRMVSPASASSLTRSLSAKSSLVARTMSAESLTSPSTVGAESSPSAGSPAPQAASLPTPPSSKPPKITDAEDFTLIPTDDGRFFLKSGGKSGRFLCYDGAFGQGLIGGRTEAEVKEMVGQGEQAPTRWRISRKKGCDGIALFADGRHDLHLAGDEAEDEAAVRGGHISEGEERTNSERDEGNFKGKGNIEKHEAAQGEVCLARHLDGTVGCISPKDFGEAVGCERSTLWSMEFRTGELFFLSSPTVDSRVRCNISGELSLSENWKGWEIWRFTEIGDGTGAVRISSFCHSKIFFTSDGVGRVRTTEDWREDGCRWTVHKAPVNPPHGGVVVKSNSSGRVLSICGRALHTTPEKSAGIFSVWHLDAAHRQHYYIYTVGTGERVGASANAPYLTKNPMKWPAEEWRVDAMDTTGETVALYSKAKKAYLASQDCGKSILLPHMSESALWKMSESLEGFTFVSVPHGRTLTRTLHTVSPEDTPKLIRNKADDKFRLDPSLPRQVNATKLKTFGIATAVAVGTTVAVPFAIGGAVAALGVAEMSVAAEAVAIGFTAAEAAANVAAVIVTARTLMTEVAVGMDDDRDEDDGMGDAVKRPFCDWRTW
uniref:Fascin domain-containing protein n=1 Tax=Odontella aurita TaxID=265563 RepID=A0A7S4HMR6_9STRA